MSKLIVHTTQWTNEADEVSDFVEWDGDYDARVHNNGCLIIVEYIPSLDISGKEKKAKQVAIYNKNEWDSVEVK